MIQKLGKAVIKRYKTKLNDYQEEEKVLDDCFEVDLAISTLTGAFSSANNIKTTNSTHSAFTYYRGLKENDVIEKDGKTFTIDFVNEFGRLPVIFVKQVEAIGE